MGRYKINVSHKLGIRPRIVREKQAHLALFFVCHPVIPVLNNNIDNIDIQQTFRKIFIKESQ